MKYSNCLIEAIKAKIKNRNVEIHTFPFALNNNQLHFYWVDKAKNQMYHYCLPGSTKFCVPLFKGTLKVRSRAIFGLKMMREMEEKNWSQKKISRTLNRMGLGDLHLPND